MLANRTPMALAADCPDAAGVRGYFDRLAADTIEMKIDPLDWIYQSYAYDAHDVAAEPRFDGDLAKALASVRARTLILGAPFDLYNPIEAARTAAGLIPRAEFLEIPSILGHQAAGASSAEAEFLNRSIAAFLRAL